MKFEAFLPQQYFIVTDKKNAPIDCMDERHKTSLGYKIPGGKKGALADALAAVFMLLFPNGITSPDDEALAITICEKFYNIAEGVMHAGHPAISFHDGDKHHDGISPCAGCGYLYSSLEGQAYLPPLVAKFLKQKATDSNYDVPYLSGDHFASYVVFVKGDHIGIRPQNSDGVGTYVVHTDVRDEILAELTTAFHRSLKTVFSHKVTFSEEELNAKAISVANERLGEVAKNLHADKIPHYEVWQLENGDLAYKQTYFPDGQEREDVISGIIPIAA